MFSADQYSLLDFGEGRRLERFNGLILDRLCPAAENAAKANRTIWRSADARFQASDESTNEKRKSIGERGIWVPTTEKGREFLAANDESTDGLILRCDLEKRTDSLDSLSNGDSNGEAASSEVRSEETETAESGDSASASFCLELKGSPFGHLGVFPEQSRNWERIYRLCRKGRSVLRRPMKILNLFAYTGASSLAAATAGAEVVHLDAAKNIVLQAKRNAELTARLTGKPLSIRFIADDAVKFVRRELKRLNEYDGIILDPPTYGHGARGEVWRIARDLPRLLDDCVRLWTDPVPFLLLTCHSTGFDQRKLLEILRTATSKRFSPQESRRFRVETNEMRLVSEKRKNLTSGVAILISEK